ncbi:hypothetical protein [Erwinia phage phiEaP8]|uniref:Uncharacterized protein n=2 Tax=Caudoviricetes TaxID=2731619 RepID=A0A3G1QTM2_9CAUD|nr:hypothetical protein HYP64_gp23 [Erwinia phage phiEaP8]AWN06212.1 hypothetical protein [Erwinia phage phiEaP8]
MDEHQQQVLRDFLAEYWDRWEEHAFQNNESGQEIYELLGGEPDGN